MSRGIALLLAFTLASPLVLGGEPGSIDQLPLVSSPAMLQLPAQSPHLLVRPPPMQDKHGRLVDPRYAKHAQATVPYAQTQPGWRSPYAYGYFGARPSRHWTKHYGIREQFIQLTGR